MNRRPRHFSRRLAGALALAVLFATAGCRSAGVATPPPPTVAAQESVHWVRDSAEYRGLVLQVYAAATAELERLAPVLQPGTWAVSLDGDDTVISNSLHEKEQAGAKFGEAAWDAWVKRRQAPPLPGAVAFLERVRAIGGKIAIVTNRRAHHCADTEADFRAYAIPYDLMLCRPDGSDGQKEPRWQAVEEGTAAPGVPPLEIVLWVGDNVRDFPDLDQDLRLGADGGYARFGRDFFLIPNPMYGSWEGNPKS